MILFQFITSVAYMLLKRLCQSQRVFVSFFQKSNERDTNPGLAVLKTLPNIKLKTSYSI
jgi:hypothetical protein